MTIETSKTKKQKERRLKEKPVTENPGILGQLQNV
jgi:hypothetical protein